MCYCLALLAIFLFHFFFKSSKSLLQTGINIRPPSPPGLPIMGHLHLLKKPFHLSLQSLSHRYGPVLHLRLGRLRVLVVSSPEAVEQCFTQNDVAFADRPNFLAGEILAYNCTNLVWVPYGDLWRNLRRVHAIQAFSSHRLQGYAPLRTEEARFVAREVLIGPDGPSGNGSGREVDLRKAFFLLTRNVVMRIVGGKRWSNGPEAELFVPSKFLTVHDFFPVLRWMGYEGADMKKLRDVWAGRDRVVGGLLEQARKAAKVNGGDTKKTTMVEEMLALQKAEPEYYTDDILKASLVWEDGYHPSHQPVFLSCFQSLHLPLQASQAAPSRKSSGLFRRPLCWPSGAKLRDRSAWRLLAVRALSSPTSELVVLDGPSNRAQPAAHSDKLVGAPVLLEEDVVVEAET